MSASELELGTGKRRTRKRSMTRTDGGLLCITLHVLEDAGDSLLDTHRQAGACVALFFELSCTYLSYVLRVPEEGEILRLCVNIYWLSLCNLYVNLLVFVVMHHPALILALTIPGQSHGLRTCVA